MTNYTLGIALVLLMLLSFIEPSFAAASGTTPLPTPIGRVVWIKGTFTAGAANGEVRTLQKKSIIYLHDILKTDDKSEAEVVFTDNTLMTFKESTTYTVDKYVDKKKNGSFVSNLTAGGFRTITGLISKNNPANYQVNTPVATIGVRGTDYQVALHEGKLFIALFKGVSCVQNKPTDPTKKAAQACVDKDHPYAEVSDANVAPKFLNSLPEEIGTQLIITQTTMSPFQITTSPSGGPITSFCISK